MEAKRFDLDVGKRRARRAWKEFVKKRVFNRKAAQVLCFPGEYGFEIEQCYRPLGFKDENIWGIERDPKAAKAIQARYPNINLIEMDLEEFSRTYDGPPFSVVSLDYCGHFGQDKIKPLMFLTLAGRLSDRCCVAVNLMAGREHADDKKSMRSLYARVLQDKANLKGKFIDVQEAIDLVNNANEEDIAEVRDNAVTHSILSSLGYIIPSMRVAYDFNLTKTQGTAVALQPGTRILSTTGTKMQLENVTIPDGSDKIQVALQIKHEAIQDIKKLVFTYADSIAKFIKTEPDYWKERVDLGGGEAIPVDEEKLKQRVIDLVKKGRTTEEIAEKVPYLSVGTIRAIRAHCTMETYKKTSA